MLDLDRLKICFLAGTLGRGGAERQLIYMLKVLQSIGVSTRVLCLTEGEPLEADILSLGIRVEHVGQARRRAVRLFRITESLRREPAQIIQSTHFYTNLYAAVAARILRMNEIGAIRCDLISGLHDNGVVGWGHLHLPRHQIVNSNLARDRAKNKGIRSDRLFFVPNVVDNYWMRSAKNGNSNRAFGVLFAGRLSMEKRPDRFLRAVSKLAHRLPAGSIRAVIAGDGPLKAELVALANTLGFQHGQLELVGEQGDMRKLYREADLLMLTSDSEGTPNVLLEAMAGGLPVIATRVGGVSDIVGADRGFVVEPNDENGLVDCALRLYREPNLRQTLGARGREYVTNIHSLDALRDRLIDVYQKVLSR